MSATDAEVARVKRLCGIDDDDATYTSTVVAEYIERYPALDSDGNDPSEDDWTDTYDIYAAAADLCDEKAVTFAGKYDFNADGGNFSVSQEFDHWRNLAAHYRSRRKAKSTKVRSSRPYVLAEEVEDYNADQIAEVGSVSEGVRTEDIG